MKTNDTFSTIAIERIEEIRTDASGKLVVTEITTPLRERHLLDKDTEDTHGRLREAMLVLCGTHQGRLLDGDIDDEPRVVTRFVFRDLNNEGDHVGQPGGTDAGGQGR